MALPYTRLVQELNDESGHYFYGRILELDGCQSTGNTLEELYESMNEAMEGYLEVMLEEKLPAALEDFYKLYELERSSYYRIQVKNHVEQLPFRDILYILKEGKYAVFHLRSGRTASVRRTLSQVYAEIGQEYFCLADRGCLINLANVTGMDGERILMPDGERVAISRSGVAEFKSALLRFWEKQI